MIAICAGAGGVGKTSITMGLGQAVCRYLRKKVLYVSLEEIESTDRYMECDGDKPSLGEYLYFLLKKEKANPAQEGFMVWDEYGLQAFRPDSGRNRLRELNKGQMAAFLNAVVAEGGYEYIVIDFGESLDPVSTWVLQQCSKVVTVCKEVRGSGNENRKRRFDAYIKFLLGKRANDALIQVQNMVWSGEDDVVTPGIGSESKEEKNPLCHVKIDLDAESFRDEKDICRISIDQDFGMGIKSLMEKIV